MRISRDSCSSWLILTHLASFFQNNQTTMAKICLPASACTGHCLFYFSDNNHCYSNLLQHWKVFTKAEAVQPNQCLLNESTLVRALIPQAGLVNEPKQWYVARGYSLDRRNKFFMSDITHHLPETVFTKCKPHSNRAKHSGIENFQTCYILHMHYKLAFGPTLLNFMHV